MWGRFAVSRCILKGVDEVKGDRRRGVVGRRVASKERLMALKISDPEIRR
jgi:hypothetical protein